MVGEKIADVRGKTAKGTATMKRISSDLVKKILVELVKSSETAVTNAWPTWGHSDWGRWEDVLRLWLERKVVETARRYATEISQSDAEIEANESLLIILTKLREGEHPFKAPAAPAELVRYVGGIVRNRFRKWCERSAAKVSCQPLSKEDGEDMDVPGPPEWSCESKYEKLYADFCRMLLEEISARHFRSPTFEDCRIAVFTRGNNSESIWLQLCEREQKEIWLLLRRGDEAEGFDPFDNSDWQAPAIAKFLRIEPERVRRLRRDSKERGLLGEISKILSDRNDE